MALSAGCSVTGWVLSACHQLNVRAYLMAISLTLVLLGIWLWRSGGLALAGAETAASVHRWSRRLRRPLPLGFAVLVVLSFLSGALYAPMNGDTHAYRLPRLLHWLAEGTWHYVQNPDGRMNYYGNGAEWVYAPLLLFTHSDRLLFLPNLLAFVQIPGLAFLLFRGMGVSGRTAWYWAWLTAAGWTFALQASSVVNDLHGVPLALAALGLALRAVRRQCVSDWWWSLLAIALLSNVKQVNLPLALPWMIAALAAWRLPLTRPARSLAVCGVAAVASCGPITALNLAKTGNWLGWSSNTVGIPESPWIGLLGDTFTMIVRNLVPPIFPWASAWNQKMEQFLATSFGAHFRSFEYFGHLDRGTGEEGMGFGLLPVLFVLLSLAAARWHARGATACRHRTLLQKGVALGIGLAVLAFLAKLASYTNARLFASFYIPLLAIFLAHPGLSALSRRRWWNALAVLVVISSIGLVVMSRARPLWPCATIMGWAHQHWPQSKLVGLVSRSYGYLATVEGYLDEIRRALPPEEKIIGKVSWAPAEGHLWKPYGTRKVVHISTNQTPDQVRAMGIRCVVVSDKALKDYPEQSLENWLKNWRGEVQQNIRIRLHPEAPPEEDEFVRIVRLQ